MWFLCFFFLESYQWTTLFYHYKHGYKYMILSLLFLYQIWMGNNTNLHAQLRIVSLSLLLSFAPPTAKRQVLKIVEEKSLFN